MESILKLSEARDGLLMACPSRTGVQGLSSRYRYLSKRKLHILERKNMKTIELGYNYRLKRLDSMNWELEHFHLPVFHGKPTSDKPKWIRTGHFYQKLSAALLAVYELVLREDDGEAVDLMDALARAEEIEKSLKAVSVDLLKLQ